jgi:DNA-binding FadR family transcriptional regulator
MSRLHREPMRIILGEIAAGIYVPTDFLPRETDLAERFGISRGVAREMVRSLEERGVVHVTHGRGASVTPTDEWDVFDPDVLAALLQGPDGAAVLSDYLECRRILEIEAAGLAAERASGVAVAELEMAYERMRENTEVASRTPAAERLWVDADIAFHRALVRATGNYPLGRMTEPVHRALATAMPQLARPSMRFQRALPEHRKILEAVVRHQPTKARSAMRAHLLTVETYLQEYARERVADKLAVAK